MDQLMVNNKLSSKKILIFLHIHKTAGTSLRNIVERFYEKNEIYFIYDRSSFNHMSDFNSLSDAEKIKIKIFYGHVTFGLHKYIPQPCNYITVLRDPIERILSLYWHLSVDENYQYHQKIKYDKMPVAEFVQSGLAIETDNYQTRVVSGMEAEFGKCTIDMLETAKENIRKQFVVVGLSEYFDESVLLMKRTLGWKVPFHFYLKKMVLGATSPLYERTNVSTDKRRKEDLSADDLNTINKFNELDMQLYAHAEKLLYEQINQQGTSFKKELEKLKRWRD